MHLILDLDETCISAVEYDEQHTCKTKDCFVLTYDNVPEFVVARRPHLETFLKWAVENCSVSIWSAGQKDYVLDIVRNIFGDNEKYLRMILWRDHCNQSLAATGILKNIHWIINKIPTLKELGHPILIDDLEDNCKSNHLHSIQISKFDSTSPDSINDTSLLRLISILERIQQEAYESQ